MKTAPVAFRPPYIWKQKGFRVSQRFWSSLIHFQGFFCRFVWWFQSSSIIIAGRRKHEWWAGCEVRPRGRGNEAQNRSVNQRYRKSGDETSQTGNRGNRPSVYILVLLNENRSPGFWVWWAALICFSHALFMIVQTYAGSAGNCVAAAGWMSSSKGYT